MRAKTEEERSAASERQKRHWKRCEAWGQILEVSKMEINDHWSCCIKTARGDRDGVGQPPIDVVLSVRKAYSECLLKKAKGSKALADWHYRRQREEQVRSTSPTVPSDYDTAPELEQRIKIMIWAVKKVGGIENARDALERAIRSLEDV